MIPSLLVLLTLAQPLPTRPADRSPDFRWGVALGLFASTPDPEYQQILYLPMLREIAALGATDVQLSIRWLQVDAQATTMGPARGVTPDDATVRALLEEAARLKLRVFILPIVHLQSRTPGVWRGTLKPTDPERWWAAYRTFILHYAQLAAGRADLLAVGSELVSQEADVDRWRALIRDVRAAFPGRLTYSANWDHYEPVAFWDALDVVGVSAYWPLARAPGASVEAMQAAWAGVRGQIERFAAAQNRPYLLTEVGYPSHAFAAVRPWDQDHQGPVDQAAQADAWTATLAAWDGAPRLSGLFVWNWFGVGGPDDSGYTPRGKAAETLLKSWFCGATQRGCPAPPGDAAPISAGDGR